MLRIGGALFAAVLIVLGLGACGGGSEGGDVASNDTATTAAGSATTDAGAGSATTVAAGSASARDACPLFTNSDIAAATGSDPGAGVESDKGTRATCTYEMGVATGVDDARVYPRHEETYKSNDSAKCEDVSGLGQDALYCVVFGGVGMLAWVDGGLMYEIVASTGAAPVKLEDMRTLAGKKQS